MPSLVPNYCTLNFQVQVLAFGTGTTIQENAGFGPGGASCNTNPVLPANNSVSGQLKVCNCSDARDPCTTDLCDPTTGCYYPPIVCNDQDACTTDACVNGVCVYTPIVCNDQDVCTTDACDERCVRLHADREQTTRMRARRMRATRDGLCGVHAVCTNDERRVREGRLDPVTGVCVYTPVSANDKDACTTDACDPVTGVSHTPVSTNKTRARRTPATR